MRPINYKKIGEDLIFSAHFTGENAAEEAYLVKQNSMTKVRLRSTDEQREEVLTIVQTVTNAGECSLEVGIPNDEVIFSVDGATIVSAGTLSDGDGTYPVTFVGGTSTVAATGEVEVVGGEIVSITVDESGTYTVKPTNPVTLIGLTGTAPTVNLTWDENSDIERYEHLKKLSHHRLTTFEGGSYKWYLNSGADESGDEANLSPI